MAVVKKAKSGNRTSKARAGRPPATVSEYMTRVAGPARHQLKQLRAVIRSVVPPQATEIISYGIPAFRHEKVLVWYAAFSGHCSLFPTAAVIEGFKKELKGYSTSIGTIHFPADQPLPVALLKKLVRARVEQCEG